MRCCALLCYALLCFALLCICCVTCNGFLKVGFIFDFETDRLIHAPNAIITRFNENNDFQRHTITEEHKPLHEPYMTSLYEIEVNRVSQEYGNIAHVWSTFAMMETLESEPFLRGINSISLYYKDDRWWIASWETQYESDTKVPEKYLLN